MLGSAAGNAFASMIDGTKSFSEAMNSLVADTIVGIGKDAATRAGFHGAMALASLALGPIGGVSAAGHAKAAAAFGLVAAGAGVTAAGLRRVGVGGSSSNSAAAAAAGSSVGRGSGGRFSGPAAPVVIVTRDLDGDERQQAQRMRKLIRLHERNTGGRTVRVGV